MKKEAWIEGPDLPKNVIAKIASSTLMCITALNRTSALFIGIGESTEEMLLYDFAKGSWIELESSPKLGFIPKPKIGWCTSSSAHDKNYNQYV